jgi:hypothetical protein
MKFTATLGLIAVFCGTLISSEETVSCSDRINFALESGCECQEKWDYEGIARYGCTTFSNHQDEDHQDEDRWCYTKGDCAGAFKSSWEKGFFYRPCESSPSEKELAKSCFDKIIDIEEDYDGIQEDYDGIEYFIDDCKRLKEEEKFRINEEGLKSTKRHKQDEQYKKRFKKKNKRRVGRWS